MLKNMETFKLLTLEHSNGISTITLDRADKNNAINAELITELKQAIQESQTAKTHCLLLKAKGRHFCAGADLNWMRASKEFSVERNKEDAWSLARLLLSISSSRKPVISVIQGRAMGGACGLIAASDIAIANKNSSFCFSEVKLGLIPATIAPHVLRRVGYQSARRYFLTADCITAETAEKIKLIDHVVENSQAALELAHLTAEQLGRNGPNALLNTKVLLNKLRPIDNNIIDYTATMLANIRVSDEAQEGLNAFFQKRDPNWCNNDK